MRHKTQSENECTKCIPFVDLVAAKLLEVTLDMNDQRDIKNNGRKHHEHGDDPQCEGKCHQSHGNSRHETEAIGPNLWVEVSVLVPVLVSDCNEDDPIDDLSWPIRKYESLPSCLV